VVNGVERIGIIGAGKIGSMLYDMLDALRRRGLNLTVSLADRVSRSEQVLALDAFDAAQLYAFVGDHDAIVCAGPHTINEPVMRACATAQVAYFDFTEDRTMASIAKVLGESLPSTFLPQCGLAPGMVNIIAADLISKFDSVDAIKLRVGALPQKVSNQLGYYRTWATEGLVNEYCRPCDALFDGSRVRVTPLENLEILVLDGVTYEAFNTSGGAATMCETYAGKVNTLDYKSLRYPGHCEKMRFLLHDLALSQEEVVSILNHRLPTTMDDFVIVYIEVEGYKDTIALQTKSVFRKIMPDWVCGEERTAIQIATASSMAAVLELWLKGKIGKGFIAQETIRLDDILSTYWGKSVWSTEKKDE
jgi:saccharopine dehydrogenase-like NADP-dependent oxidoreductase